MDTLSDGQAFHTSPYVMQMEKMAESLKYFSRTFLKLEKKADYISADEMKEMFLEVKDKVCVNCDKCSWCWGENFIYTYQMCYEILSVVESYGVELNTETKRKLLQRCVKAPRFLREMLTSFQGAKQALLWKTRMIQNREGCAMELASFAKAALFSAQEMERSIILDEQMERKVTAALEKIGVHTLRVTFLIMHQGKLEVRLTCRCWKSVCVTVKEAAQQITKVAGRVMIPDLEGGSTISEEYTTLQFMEKPAFFTMQGIARVGKGCDQISGDSFSMLTLPEAKEGVILSDGMGAGERASRESTLVVELLEELLDAGFSLHLALQMINTALVMGREDIHYATVDMCLMDLYSGECSFVKAGASSTFIKYKDSVEHLASSSLPLGVVQNLEEDQTMRKLSDGDYVIMVTDGILDALPVGEQDVLITTIIQGTDIRNPKEMAQHILRQILNWTGEEPMDDMTVLVVGIWKERG